MMNINHWRELGAAEDVLGHQIWVTEINSDQDETVLLVHGFPTFTYDWAPIVPALMDYRLIGADMLGFGYSDKPYPHKYSIHEQADIVIRAAEQKGVKTCHILAHDYGDTVVQEILARSNAGEVSFEIKSVCFLNGGLFPETHQALVIQKLLLSPLGPLINRLTTKARFDKSFSAVFGPDTKPTEEELALFWDVINSGGGRHMFHSLITYMSDRRENRARWIDAIGEFDGPVALINGSFDPVSGKHMVARFIELLGEPAFLREYAEIGHYPQLEAPEQVGQDYLAFLSEVPA